ncbi:hypothetical protein Btru_000728 [Bulinus truncatus]|nr:hypothetical protein Btru_000728 [Bulinus truncatus]
MSLEPAAGRAKKFLYISSGNNKSPEIDNSKYGAQSANQQSPRGSALELNNVWSIKNVGLSSRNTQAMLPRSDMSKNVPTAYYSRHGGLNGHGGGSTHVDTSGAKWVSSGHNYSPSSQVRPSSGTPSSRSKATTYSPLDRDINDF